MKCPVCTTVDLLMSDRNGIEIDYCPQCRGVWLDRGELDKLIERAGSVAMPQGAQQQPVYGSQTQYNNHQQNHHGQHGNQYPQHHKKREGFWGELFDFD